MTTLKMQFKLLLLLLIVMVFVGCEFLEFDISGTVNDESGNPLNGVVVNLSGASNASEVTDANGSYSFASLRSGTYTVTPQPDTEMFFEPVSIDVVINDEDIYGVDFVRKLNEPVLLVVSDDFNREDGDLGDNWTAVSDSAYLTQTLGISSNAVINVSGNVSLDDAAGCIYTGTIFDDNQYAEIKLPDLSSMTGPLVYGVFLRGNVQDGLLTDGNMIYFYIENQTTWGIGYYRITDSVYDTPSEFSDIYNSYSIDLSNVIFKVAIDDNVITYYLNDEKLGSTIGAVSMLSGYPGILTNSSVYGLDNFEAGDVESSFVQPENSSVELELIAPDSTYTFILPALVSTIEDLELSINWGDGTVETVTSSMYDPENGDMDKFTHSYNAAGTYSCVISGDVYSAEVCVHSPFSGAGNYENARTTITAFNNCSKLKAFILGLSLADTFDFGVLSDLTQLISIGLGSNPSFYFDDVTGDLSELPQTMNSLGLNYGSWTGTIDDLVAMDLKNINDSSVVLKTTGALVGDLGKLLSKYDGYRFVIDGGDLEYNRTTLPSSFFKRLNSIDLNCGLSDEDIDNLLIDMANVVQRVDYPGYINSVINLNGASNGSPTSVSADARAILHEAGVMGYIILND